MFMKICKTISEVRSSLREERHNGKSIGLVPTMGALHNGHLELIKNSNQKCEITIASIFVNPAQFNNPDDLKKYPNTIEQDIDKLERANCDYLFLPSAEEVYPQKSNLKISFGSIGEQLEGKFRPGHFDGVALVVSKLFNIVQPDQAFFGQKDLQQFFIVKALIDQLNFPIEMNMVPTMREEGGLAMSSRNMRLTADDRLEADLIYSSLKNAQNELLSGKEVNAVTKNISELFDKSERFTLEYFEVVNTDDFKKLISIEEKEKVALCIAAEIGQVRLIDNLMLIS